MHKLLSVVLAAFIALSAIAFPAAPAAAVEIYAGNTDRTFLGTTSVTDLVVSGTLGVTGASTFSGTATFNKTAATGAETIADFKVSDVASSYIRIGNASITDGVMVPLLYSQEATNNQALIERIACTTDSGSNAVVYHDRRTVAGAAVTTRPLDVWYNSGTAVFSFLPLNSGANLALSWGTQTGAAPAFTTRSAGTRLVLYSAITGSKVDNAIGVTASGAANTYSVQEATSSYKHSFYAGQSEVAIIRGDGLWQTSGGQTEKARVATTTPVTVSAGTDYYVVTKLGTPGTVAVNLPAGATGQVFVIQDGTGDAAANNITITPAAGTINGAATLVINADYGAKTLRYSGTEWLAY